MRPPAPWPEVEAWLRGAGWFAGRGEWGEAERLVAVRVADAARQGVPLEPWGAVLGFVARFVGLRFPVPLAPERVFLAHPALGYEGDAEDIAELAGDLGRRLFPVGYETGEAGIVLLDDLGRFFYLHHTGPSFLGHDEAQALSSLMRGDQDDIGEFYV
ncbi:SUKH-3 domain-containing protein [Streptomyces antimicrobicus]|uniref:SUKH-3 domain-containing protein n=1 Tax=Streptomyces antimicrobicus TaxID=2883108 RepID=A0ABS8B4Y1_9ACTN|nr:SUKH-3 domain-containing protein [Streptomyces antimicrobicus]MCB5179666.1 SUKH-3 domain-containing protein [Streptomyces antimicrobicus]